MVKVAQNLKLHLRVGHMLRYSPALRLARSWLQNAHGRATSRDLHVLSLRPA